MEKAGIERFLKGVQENLSITLTIHTDSGNTLLTNIPMGIKGWNMISFSGAELMEHESSGFLKDTIIVGMSLVGLTLLAVVLICIAIAESGRRFRLEQERYIADDSECHASSGNCETYYRKNRTKVRKEKTLDTYKNMLYDKSGD